MPRFLVIHHAPGVSQEDYASMMLHGGRAYDPSKTKEGK